MRRRPVTGQRNGAEGPGVANGAHVAGAETGGDGHGGTATLTAVPGSPGSPGTGGQPGPDDAARAPRAGGRSRLALSNWRVRWRLLALIIIPTLAAVILGGLRISSAASSAVAFKRTEQLAVLNSNVIRLAQSMEDKRDLTAGYIANGRPTGTESDPHGPAEPAGRHRAGRPAGHRGREQHRRRLFPGHPAVPQRGAGPDQRPGPAA